MSLVHPDHESSPLGGMDFSWIAVDREGHVGWFVTFGSAVVPEWIELQARGSSDEVPNAERLIATLPRRGDYRSIRSAAGDEQWTDAASRGLFAFDWDIYSGPYQIIARPSVPLHVDDLPADLAVIARRSCFNHLSFGERGTIDASDVERCVSWTLESQPGVE